jgi:pimeloyl-ACP methyl ester carboxylesterase
VTGDEPLRKRGPVNAPALVLLTGVRGDPAQWESTREPLARAFRLLTPSLPVTGPSTAPFVLEDAAAAVAAALDTASLPSAAVCGIGLGAMVALRLAAAQPARVSHLALVTRQVAVSPLLMSLPAVVLKLLPATAVARLGAGQPQILSLLDQVRPVDAVPLASRVTVPSTVLCGARDRINRRASERLAQALPQGRLQLIPRAGPAWPTQSPQLLADALTDVLGD